MSAPDHESLDPAVLARKAIEALGQGLLVDALGDIDRLRLSGAEPALSFHLAGLASLRANEIGKAVNAIESAHRLSPEINEPVEVLAILYAKLGRLTDSLYYGKLSIAAKGRFPIEGLIPDWLGSFEQSFFSMKERPLVALAEQAMAFGNYQEAIRHYRQALEIDDKAVEVWRPLATAYRLAGKPFESLDALRRIDQLTTPEAIDYSALGETLEKLGRWQEARQCHERAVSMAPLDAQIGWAPVRCLINEPAARAEIASAATHWASVNARAPIFDTPMPLDLPPLSERPLRVGLLTASWLNPSGLALIIPLLMALPRERIALHVYSEGFADTPLARRLRGQTASWETLNGLDDETAAFTLGNEELDIVIDLDGPRRRYLRPVLFQYQPHPLCFSLLDAPETAKAAGFTGAIVDSTDGLSIDGVIGIPGIAINLPQDLSLLANPVATRDRGSGPTVFGSLASFGRISMNVIAIWADILGRAANAILLLEPHRLGGSHGVAEIMGQFAKLGLSQRVQFAPPEQPAADYLAQVDLLLDPPGCVEFEEAVVALVAGVPVLTTHGRQPSTQILAKWVEVLGLPELHASDGASYVERACSMADSEIYTTLRQRLRAAIDRESQFGTPNRARVLERVLRARVSGTIANV